MTDTDPFARALQRRAAQVERELDALLDARPRDGELVRPERLVSAMRHGVLNGGKRFRPFLVMESAAVFDATGPDVVRTAAALECIHCYSLIHDDLPAMDDDDLRRGQPTVHKAFDEAAAILAGDALLTLAFDILSSEEGSLPDRARLALVSAFARASGVGGMAGGQALDLDAASDRPDETGIVRLQAMKTGALIRVACEAGAILGNASPVDRERMSAFGSAIGLAFQLADDLLDATGEEAALGKAAGKDVSAGKATLVAMHGVEWTRRQLAGLVDQSAEILAPYGERGTLLVEAARFVAFRDR